MPPPPLVTAYVQAIGLGPAQLEACDGSVGTGGGYSVLTTRESESSAGGDATTTCARSVDELFNSILLEVRDEVNVPLTSLREPVLLGFMRNLTSAGRPSAAFVGETSAVRHHNARHNFDHLPCCWRTWCVTASALRPDKRRSAQAMGGGGSRGRRVYTSPVRFDRRCLGWHAAAAFRNRPGV